MRSKFTAWKSVCLASFALLGGMLAGRAETAALPEGAWTLVVIPDTQFYVGNDEHAPIFTRMTEWIVANRERRNIRLVLHVGDIVNNNRENEWRNAKRSISVLDGKLPYVLAVGNHDLGRNASDRSTMLNDHFKLADNPLNEQAFGGSYEPGRLENAWFRFRAGGWDAIIFSLEFGPREEVVKWANDVAARHPDKSLVLLTHEFVDHESTFSSADGMALHTTRRTTNNPHGYGIARNAKVHCGEELWEAFVARHANFDFVFNGHYKPFEMAGGKLKPAKGLASARRFDRLANGRLVHQMLFNAQWAPQGGEGWLRLLEFQPDGKTVKAMTYSPHLDAAPGGNPKAWRRTADCEFELDLSPRLPAKAER